MRATVAIVADDLTGAADTAAGFQRAGLDTVVTWRDAALAIDAEVIAIDLRSRAMTGGEAATVIGSTVSALRAAGIRTLYKKIDSMMRGHIGDELLAASAAWHGGAMALIAPAFPAMGRTTVGGIQRMDGIPLAAGAIARRLRSEPAFVGHVSLEQVRDGSIAAVLERQAGHHAVVCDAETDDDLRAIARAGLRLVPAPLWVGSAGLAAALAASMEQGMIGTAGFDRIAGVARSVLIVVGSGSAVAQEQGRRLAGAGAIEQNIPVAALTGDTARDGDGVVGEIRHWLSAGRDVVVTMSPAGPGDDPRIAARLGETLSVLSPLAGGLILTGGDTAAGVLDAWDVSALRLVGEIEPGMPLSVAIERSEGRPSMPVVTKAGTFGSPDALVHARRRLRAILRGVEGES